MSLMSWVQLTIVLLHEADATTSVSHAISQQQRKLAAKHMNHRRRQLVQLCALFQALRTIKAGFPPQNGRRLVAFSQAGEREVGQFCLR